MGSRRFYQPPRPYDVPLWWPCWLLDKGQWKVVTRLELVIGRPLHPCSVSDATALSWFMNHGSR